MKFEEEKFKLHIDGNKFDFYGKVEKSDYTDLCTFLKQSAAVVNRPELEFDFRNLEFLNSSGIRAIAVFFLGCDKKIKVFINTDVTWQKVGVKPLEKMKEKGQIRVIE